MSQSRKHRGYRTQRVVAEYLQGNGFPHAEPVGAGRAGTDVVGIVGVDVEVAARRGFPVKEKMRQLDARSTDGLLGVVVLRPDGMGESSVAQWPAIVCLADLVALLRAAGYGTPHARPDDWTDPAPRVLPDDLDGWRCACGVPTLPDVTHSQARCAGAETLGDSA